VGSEYDDYDFDNLRRITPLRYMAEFLGFLEEEQEEEESAKEPAPKKNKL
jgi:hypothetical protein